MNPFTGLNEIRTQRKLRRSILLPLFFVLSILMGLPGDLHANLSGDVDYSYTRLSKTSNDDSVETTNFFQRYSLLYEKDGLLRNGRLGLYNIKVGYTWASNASERNDYDSTITGDKFLYSGELTIAPGALPFRLSAYRKDLVKPHIVKHAVTDGIFPDQVNDYLYGLKSVETSLSFIAGIKNGSYMGRYRELLAKYPRLLLDYRENEVTDDSVQGIYGNRLDYKQQNLAFISLNKKDNWFHYKVYKFTDNVDSSNNTLRKQYLLGTIDHRNMRHWIDLTNWLKMSVDGSLSTQTNGSSGPENNYWLVNSYFSGAYEDLKGDLFMSYRRQREGEQGVSLKQNLDVPGYFVKDEYSRTWRTRFNLHRSKSENELTDIVLRNEQYDWGGSVVSNKEKKIVFTTGVNLSHKEGDWGDGEVVGANFGWSTNSKFRPKISWGFSSNSQYATETKPGGASSDSLTQLLQAKLSGAMLRTGRWTVGQSLLFVDGSTDQINNSGLNPSLLSSSDYSIKSDTWLELGYTSRRGVSNRFYASMLYDQGRSSGRWGVNLRYNMNYRSGNWYLNSNTSFNTGYRESTINGETDEFNSYSMIHNSRVRYRVNRLADYSGSLNYLRLEGDTYGRQEITLAESMSFHFYRKGLAQGMKLLDISQGFEWERYENLYSNGGASDSFSLLGSLTYYVNRVVTLGSRLRYTFGRSGDGEFISQNFLTVKYPLLSLRLAYSYGQNEEADEHYYEASLNKKF